MIARRYGDTPLTWKDTEDSVHQIAVRFNYKFRNTNKTVPCVEPKSSQYTYIAKLGEGKSELCHDTSGV